LGFDGKKIVDGIHSFRDVWNLTPSSLRRAIGAICLASIAFEITIACSIVKDIFKDDGQTSLFGFSFTTLSIAAAIIGPISFLFSEALEFLSTMTQFFMAKGDLSLFTHFFNGIKENFYLLPLLLNFIALMIPSAISAMLFSLSAVGNLSDPLSLLGSIGILILTIPKGITDLFYNGAYSASIINRLLKTGADICSHPPSVAQCVTALGAMMLGGPLAYVQKNLMQAYNNEVPLPNANGNFVLQLIAQQASYLYFLTYSAGFYDLVWNRNKESNSPKHAGRLGLFSPPVVGEMKEPLLENTQDSAVDSDEERSTNRTISVTEPYEPPTQPSPSHSLQRERSGVLRV